MAGSRRLTTNVACEGTFGTGMDILDGAVNVYGSDAHVVTFSIGSMMISVVLFVFL